MFEYIVAVRCKGCGKIYPSKDNVPSICKKCGAKIVDISWLGNQYTNENSESIVAKRTLFGWKVREEMNGEKVEE
jgi:uncharacterized membrane protein YvbJ